MKEKLNELGILGFIFFIFFFIFRENCTVGPCGMP